MHKIKLLIIIIISSLHLTSCLFATKAIQASKARKEFTEANNAIPPDFGKKGEVLVGILTTVNSYDKYLKSALNKKYLGEHIFLTTEELDSDSKYSDKTKYRYLFNVEKGSGSTATFSNGLSSTIIKKRQFIYDRLEDKKYISGAEFTFFAKAMKVYAENLELKRQSNK